MKWLRTTVGVAVCFCWTARAGDWDRAEKNAADARAGIRLCKRLAWAWLDQADARSGLIPRNLRGDWFWNAQDAAADNFPFYLLTAFVTDDYHLKLAALEMLRQEQRLTNRVARMPDVFLFDTQSFRPGPYKLDAVIFGASEYAKDGLTPITEWLGNGPWLDRMVGLIEDIWKYAPVDSAYGKLPSASEEVNGEMLQVTSRLYWLTGEEKYRQWVFRLTDEYFLGRDILKAERLQLDDHSCEIIGGLSEGYVVAAKTDAERWRRYRPVMHGILDRILAMGRNPDGLLHHTIDPRDGKVLNGDLTDNWGYNYNAFLTVAEVDGEERYREAVRHVLGNIDKYREFRWENGGADGYADSIEGAINLLNRIPVESAWGWVDESMAILLGKQRDSGLMEGWHGDGNTARTTLMWTLWKTQGITAGPWRTDLLLGAERTADGALRVFVQCEHPWRGVLRFDRKRHREVFHLPFDYARINQFPEWFTVEAEARYRLEREGGEAAGVTGAELMRYPVTLKAGERLRLVVRK